MHFIAAVSTQTQRLFISTLWLLALMVWAGTAQALDPVLSLKIGDAESKLLLLEKNLSDPDSRLELALIRELQVQGLFVKDVANDCIKSNEASINRDAAALDVLGAVQEKEEPEVSAKRADLNQAMLSAAQQLASCRLLLLRSHEMVDETTRRQQQALASQLLARNESITHNFTQTVLNPLKFIEALSEFLTASGGVQRLWQEMPLMVALFVISLVLAILAKRLIKERLRRQQGTEQKGYWNRFKIALAATLDRYMPPFVLFALFSLFYLYLFASGEEPDFFGLLVIGLFFYVLLNLVIRVTLNPVYPGESLAALSPAIAKLLARRLRLLSKLLLLGFLLYSALLIHDFPQHLTGLIRNIYIFLLILNLIWAVWLLHFQQSVGNILVIRSLIIGGLIVCLGADWIGYTNLSNYILWGIGGSLLAWLATLFFIRLWSDFFDSLDEGRHSWQQHLRKRLGVADGEFVPGSLWFRFTFALLIWALFAVIVLKIWGLPDTSLIILRETMVDGFTLGDVEIVPMKIVIALLSFAVMLSITGWIKRRMSKSWLNRSRMDRGAKEATISLTGYFAVAMASLIALSMAGLELSNLAIIAGALSVGIGFGLQNIVNNFISGVILLFERPIKTGDWIVVGGTEGYVRKISIRSTQLQTFDRSDVIVPNSELISGQVTNMMLRDSIGRIVVPVGVAYGTDPEQVKQILLDIAFQHPDIITQSPILSKPFVLFRAFGDSSLDFELRCYIKVVDDRLRVISEVNFAIERAFREVQIEIPFPQRVVHIAGEPDTHDALPTK